MLELLETFANNVKNNGISYKEVELIENTVGEKFITSIYNKNNLTMESSLIGSDDVYRITIDYIDEIKKTKEKKISTIDVLKKLSRGIEYFKDTLSHLKEIESNFNSNIKTNLSLRKDLFSYVKETSNTRHMFNNDDELESLFREIHRRDLVDFDINKLDEVKGLCLYIWKHNNLVEYIFEDKMIHNVNPTVNEFLNSMEEIHMNIEVIEEILKRLKFEYSKIINNSGYFIQPNDKYLDKLDAIYDSSNNYFLRVFKDAVKKLK